MGSRFKDERLINKVDELAASLHATSEVLSTADNMLEHYRDLNREQDVEIARVSQQLKHLCLCFYKSYSLRGKSFQVLLP